MAGAAGHRDPRQPGGHRQALASGNAAPVPLKRGGQRPCRSGRHEDGAHKVSADLYHWLTDVGSSIAGGSPPYWAGDAMGSTAYRDVKQTPKVLADTITTAASNAAHLARLLKASPYPPPLA
ncbi:hypothetical protein M3U23_13185 [Xanthomonas sp. PPL129]|uniref:hypothetical protein n=1 Tax=Xanthomonas sp. PPL134 TaxID=2942339 RepID=UPI0033B5832F